MILLFLLIVMRITGAVLFNPVLGRSQVPKLVKAALIFCFSLIVFASVGENYNFPEMELTKYVLLLLRELIPGLCIGFSIELVFFTVRMASSIIDYMMGLNMAQIYDPQTNSQVTISSGLYYAFFMLIIFVSNTHIDIIKLIITSGEYMPYGNVKFTPQLSLFIMTMFKESVVLGVKLAFPIMAIELLGEIAVGILMRVVPQINVFVVNFQIKIILGLFMMLFMFDGMGQFLKGLMPRMIDCIENILIIFSKS